MTAIETSTSLGRTKLSSSPDNVVVELLSMMAAISTPPSQLSVWLGLVGSPSPTLEIPSSVSGD